MAEMRKVAIVGSARIPFTRAYTGYANESNLTMLAATLSGLAEKFGLKGKAVNEVMGGAVISHSRDFNVAREAALDAGYSPRTPGTNLQIACGTSLQAALNLGAKIATGEIESGIACGGRPIWIEAARLALPPIVGSAPRRRPNDSRGHHERPRSR